VTAAGKNLIGHAGAVLLRRCADRSGLTRALNAAIPRGEGPVWWDRGTVLVSLAVSIGLGATSMSDIGLLEHQVPVFGDPPSDCTVRRCLTGLDPVGSGKVAKARAKARRRVWDLIADRAGGFPWLLVADKLLDGWIVIDLDATLITAQSDKQGAAVTFKKGYGHHPLGAWCANTTESCQAPGPVLATRLGTEDAVLIGLGTMLGGGLRAVHGQATRTVRTPGTSGAVQAVSTSVSGTGWALTAMPPLSISSMSDGSSAR
jgi:Transposase DDE domain group 1